jgi:hypothetical protein
MQQKTASGIAIHFDTRIMSLRISLPNSAACAAFSIGCKLLVSSRKHCESDDLPHAILYIGSVAA